MASENIVGKGENASNEHFLFFTQCFLEYKGFFFFFFFWGGGISNFSNCIQFGSVINTASLESQRTILHHGSLALVLAAHLTFYLLLLLAFLCHLLPFSFSLAYHLSLSFESPPEKSCSHLPLQC